MPTKSKPNNVKLNGQQIDLNTVTTPALVKHITKHFKLNQLHKPSK